MGNNVAQINQHKLKKVKEGISKSFGIPYAMYKIKGMEKIVIQFQAKHSPLNA